MSMSYDAVIIRETQRATAKKGSVIEWDGELPSAAETQPLDGFPGLSNMVVREMLRTHRGHAEKIGACVTQTGSYRNVAVDIVLCTGWVMYKTFRAVRLSYHVCHAQTTVVTEKRVSVATKWKVLAMTRVAFVACGASVSG